jgi:hypothetical protein
MEDPSPATRTDEREPDSGVFPLQGSRQEAEGGSTGRGVAFFLSDVRRAPVRRVARLVGEYGMFASGMTLAGLLFLTRVPMRLIDGATGLDLRRRFVDLLARVSPG